MVNILSLRAVAEKLIEANGRRITLIRQDQVTPLNAAKDWRENTTTTQVSISVIGAFIDYDEEEEDRTIIKRGEKRILISAKSAEEAGVNAVTDLEKYNRVVDSDNTEWHVGPVSVIQPGLQRIAYDMRVSR